MARVPFIHFFSKFSLCSILVKKKSFTYLLEYETTESRDPFGWDKYFWGWQEIKSRWGSKNTKTEKKKTALGRGYWRFVSDRYEVIELVG
jgi:hypothetical protein